MNLKHYYHEGPSRSALRILDSYNNNDHKTHVWNAFVDSDLSGITDDDFSITPRLIPESYFPVIRKTAKDITTFCLRLLTLPEEEVRAIVPRGPIRDLLIDDLKVLKHRPKRLTGSFRFDMAIVGEPLFSHAPKLLEINEIGFDGLARSSFFQKTLISLIPELKKRVVSLDTAAAEVKNMRRLGADLARVQYDCYNWDEEYLRQTAVRKGLRLHLISPDHYGQKIDEEFPFLRNAPVTFRNDRVKIGKDLFPDALNMSFAFSLKDFKKHADLYAKLVRSKTPQYGPFLTGLVASKTILILLSDPGLRRRLLGSSRVLEDAILGAYGLSGREAEVEKNAKGLVLKHADGFGGQQVFMDKDLLRKLRGIPRSKQHEWVLQEKTLLNTISVNGILSKPKRAISDLGVFVHYDWEGGKYRHFEVGGLMSRATNKGLKVNVSSGGLQVAVLLEKGR